MSAKSTIVLVTGGAGFLGSHLCDLLLAQGRRVICVDNLETGDARNVEHLGGDDFAFIRHDVVEPLEFAEEVDVVYHLATPASPDHYQRHPLAAMKVALYGTQAMLEFAKTKRARFLLASSSEVYGDPQVHPQPETYCGNVNPLGPRSPYGEGKRYAEAMTIVYRREGLDTAIARPFNVYGPRMSPNDGRVVPSFLRQALPGQPLVVFGDGSQTRSLCYVDDLVRGLVLLAESDEHDPVNLGNPGAVTMLELAESVLRTTGSASGIVFEPLPVNDPKRRCPDITRAIERLGWRPSVPLEEGIRRTAAAASVPRGSRA